MAMRGIAAAAAVATTVLASGCAQTTPEGALIADPYESLNRDIHSFNTGVDQVLLRPAARGYQIVTPTLFQNLISNFVEHIRLPVTFINYALQGEVDGALETAGRFGVNTIMGAAGLLDPATEMGLPYQPTDFGLTMATWGAEEGPYVVLPFFGPSTGRDAVGVVVNAAINPVTYVTLGDGAGQAAAAAGQVVTPPLVFRSENMALIDELLYESADSYVAARSAYVQSRRARVAGEAVDVEALPDIYGE